jgi:hypothetical protein
MIIGYTMSDIGRRVKLTEWRHEGLLQIGDMGTILSEAPRYIVVKWDSLSGASGMAMRPEEVALT